MLFRSVNLVEKKLSLPSKYISHIPKCQKEIQRHLESQEAYWAREAIWAVKQILKNKEMLQWVTVRRMTNMKRTDLQSCLKEVKKMTNQNMYELIEALAFGNK